MLSARSAPLWHNLWNDFETSTAGSLGLQELVVLLSTSPFQCSFGGAVPLCLMHACSTGQHASGSSKSVSCSLCA